jgi:hypothetical protein
LNRFFWDYAENEVALWRGIGEVVQEGKIKAAAFGCVWRSICRFFSMPLYSLPLSLRSLSI